MKARGFTLIEVLVALVLVAAAVTIAYRALSAVIAGSEQVGTRMDAARDVDRLFARLERELMQRVPAEVRAARLSGGPDRLALESFVPDAGGQPRAQQLEYALENGALVRRVAPARRDVVFEAVSALQFRFLGADLQWATRWGAEAEAYPRAVEVRVKLGTEDAVRVFALP